MKISPRALPHDPEADPKGRISWDDDSQAVSLHTPSQTAIGHGQDRCGPSGPAISSWGVSSALPAAGKEKVRDAPPENPPPKYPQSCQPVHTRGCQELSGPIGRTSRPAWDPSLRKTGKCPDLRMPYLQGSPMFISARRPAALMLPVLWGFPHSKSGPLEEHHNQYYEGRGWREGGAGGVCPASTP